MDNLLEFNLQELTEYIKKFGHKPYRAKQLLRWIYYFNEDHFEVMTDVAKSFQTTLKNNAKIVTPEITFDPVEVTGPVRTTTNNFEQEKKRLRKD